ncbi:NADPH-dependent FMN reductase [Terrabacter sp. 2RAF25]|uniref:NADPH-dependent FMN reductase n=1 Tax=Terrabacter sp. 2RAF25 TaxID=3232998 RepID=UPI003F960E0D
MNQLRIIVSSTRPGRIGPKVAEWVAAQAPADAWEVELLDLSTLPFFDEEDMPKNGNYAKPHTKDWASKVFESDAIVVVTPQYNRSFPAPVKNAIDYLFAEWDSKPIALVGYGWTGASDATADLTKVLEHVKADVVGSTGLVFTQDISPEGELDVTAERRAELAGLLEALGSKVTDLDSVSAG